MTSDAAVALAEELGVDLDTVKGTGFLGNKLVKDVQAAADAAGPDSKTVELPVVLPETRTLPAPYWVRAGWNNVRIISVGRQALGDEFGVAADEITVTKLEPTPTVAFVTGHVTE